jgi:transcriptional regulator with XRE-family HTH domain
MPEKRKPSSPESIALGRLVSDGRNLRKMGATELAAACGVEMPHIRKIEAGQRLPTPELLEKLIDALGLDGPATYFTGQIIPSAVVAYVLKNPKTLARMINRAAADDSFKVS